jgi:hypothetical protein
MVWKCECDIAITYIFPTRYFTFKHLSKTNCDLKFMKCESFNAMNVGSRIILRWIFRKVEGVVGTGWSWLRIGTGGGHL